MNAKERNAMLFKIVTNTSYYLEYAMSKNKSFYELSTNEINDLVDIAQAILIKPQYGKSPARTLWDRANEGRPF